MAEFVSLANKQFTTNVNEVNTNPMGGCNLCQQQRANTDHSDGTTVIHQRIKELKAKWNIGAIVAHICSITSNDYNSKQFECPPNTRAINESDTNAETGVAGSNMIPISFTTRSADVYSYLPNQNPIKDVPIVSAATAYDCPSTNQTYILIFHEFLWYGN